MTSDRDDETTPKSQPRDASEPKFSRTDADLAAGETLPVIGDSLGDSPAQQPNVAPQTARRVSPQSAGSAALLVGLGILISRVIGLVRQRVFAHYFGLSAAGDAFTAAFRIPNFLQNVFGEGALSASFIPVYAKLLARDDGLEAQRVAGAIFSLLMLVTSVLVLVGVLATPYLIDVIAPGFDGETRELTISLVRIFFPGAGLLVLSAWCLGVLNSHRRFFLSYTAPVIWNVSIIVALIVYGSRVAQFRLAELAAWGSVIGSALQFGIQLPTVMRLVGHLRLSLDITSANVRMVIRSFLPVFVSRGVVQISAYVDSILASFLGVGAMNALGYTQSLYTLPVSLFGMSVSAAELPEMSSTEGSTEKVAAQLQQRLNSGLRQIAFFVVPSAMAFFALGDVITAALYQTGQFQSTDVLYVWGILAGASIGLLASTLGRLYSSTYYALHDTRTPLRYALLRILIATICSYLFAIVIPSRAGIDPRWGVAGITVASSVAGWVEFFLLRRKLNKMIGETGLPALYTAQLWLAALLSAGVGWLLKLAVGTHHPILIAMLVLGLYGTSYFSLTFAFRLPESRAVFGRLTHFVRQHR